MKRFVKIQTIIPVFIVMVCLITSIEGMAQAQEKEPAAGNAPIENEPIDFGEGDKKKEPIDEDQVYTVVELSPEFPGGGKKMYEFIRTTMKYPKKAKKDRIEGVVYVEFVVQKDGSITHIKVSKSVFPALDKEALRIVSSMPKWNPGKQENKAVNVKYALPIEFKLEGSR